ncbi:hypothetical protein SO694_00058165 [Aureococcus anophagefferens]|uniref:EF-hand domain-containing protein n=1 Tax=Aureococcus anophagefferens TaxID=44056 RepID=A0ABR1FYY0_AURAN|nr:hypothetical protein JL722_13722 [Aureococcus anophagefferens]
MSIYEYAANNNYYSDEAELTPNVTCRNATLVVTDRRRPGLALLPGGRWIVNGSDAYWNGTDCVVRASASEAAPFELPMAVVGPLIGVLAAAAAVGVGVCLLERRRKRLLRVHGASPASLTEDSKSFTWRFLLGVLDLLQSTCFDWCGLVCPRRLDRIEFLSTRYNDFTGSVFKVFVDLKIHGQERLRWLDAWATLDKDASNSVDFSEFADYFALPPSAYSRRFFDTFNEDQNGAVPIRGFPASSRRRGKRRTVVTDARAVGDFLAQTWATCAVDKTCCETLSFRLLCRRAHWDERVSVLDIKDLEHFIHHRYKFRRTNAKKKAFQVFSFVDADGSGGIDFREFRKFSDDNAVFLGLGHGYQRKMRDKLFGHDYWAKQTGKRKSLYALDRDFHAKMDAYYAARYDATKAPSFWDDFPEVYERCCELLRAEAKKAATLETLHVSMRANLHRRMIAALENLTVDSTTLRGSFYKWKQRARLATKMRAAVDDMTGANDDAKPLDESVHLAIVQASDRSTPTHEMILDLRAKNLRESARKLSRKQALARADAGASARLVHVSPPKTRVIAVR